MSRPSLHEGEMLSKEADGKRKKGSVDAMLGRDGAQEDQELWLPGNVVKNINKYNFCWFSGVFCFL